MSYRPYPSIDRARHQLDRHQATAPKLTDLERFRLGCAALRAASWTGQELAEAWRAALKPRPVGSEEKSG